jgi:hypothetical protein
VHGERTSTLRHRSDRPVPLVVELSFAEEHVRGNVGSNAPSGTITRTKIQVVMRPKRNRDRRHANAIGRARQLLASLRSYLMASDDCSQADEGVLRRATHMLVPWLLKKDE